MNIKNKKKEILLILITLIVLLSPLRVLADEGTKIGKGCNAIFTTEALDLIREILGYFTILGPTVLIIMIAIDLLRAVVSGEKDEFSKATGRIAKRVIAAILLLIVPLIVTILLNLPGVVDYLQDAGIVDNPLCGALILLKVL